jgi:hypothetical protein
MASAGKTAMGNDGQARATEGNCGIGAKFIRF